MEKLYENKECREENLVLGEDARSRYPQRVLDDIERALAESGKGIRHEEVMENVSQWLNQRRAVRSGGNL